MPNMENKINETNEEIIDDSTDRQKKLEYKRNYNNVNREKITEYHKNYNKKYFEKNKDRLNEPNKCEICGGQYQTSNKAHHMKSMKHIRKIKNT
jgi:hypothetical protein